MKTDSQLQQDVIAELKWEPAVQATRIGVEVKDGVVTLAGQVDSYGEKWAAERATQRVSGVKALAVELKVALPGPQQRGDADIAAAVDNVLAWNAAVPAGVVKVMVEGGWVTLAGDVDWHYQRQAAHDSVCQLMGVIGVSNQIRVNPRVLATVVKADIEAALKRTAHSDARPIAVAVHGSDVTLSGPVHDWHERQAALTATWATPGVRTVVDQLTLV